MESNYDDRVLLSLRRQYSKDETVAALNKQLSKVEVKNGILLDEIDELKGLIRDLNGVIRRKESNRKLKKEIEGQQELRNKLFSRIAILEKENEELKQNK